MKLELLALKIARGKIDNVAMRVMWPLGISHKL